MWPMRLKTGLKNPGKPIHCFLISSSLREVAFFFFFKVAFFPYLLTLICTLSGLFPKRVVFIGREMNGNFALWGDPSKK